MFKHSLLLFIRNIRRNKTSFFINLIGLSTGLACALLIYLWVQDEIRVDKFHEKDKRLFQVMLNMPGPNGIETIEYTPGLLAQALAEELPEVEYSAAVIHSGIFGSEGIISYENIQLKAAEQYVSKDYFNIFSYRLLQGDINQVLSDKKSVLISDEMARKLFKTSENSIGKAIQWKREIFVLNFTDSYFVSGVFEKPPSNSAEQFDLVFSYELFFEKLRDNLQKWTNQTPRTFLILKEGTSIEQFNAKIKDFIKSKAETDNTIFLRRYSDKYLYGKYENGIQKGGRIVYVKLFSLIALFILMIACINFINLSTAKGNERIKEVGVKKAVGAGRKTLFAQYMGESLILVILSVFIALILIEAFLPQFNTITGKHLNVIYNLNVVLITLGIALFTGLVAGSYPALYLSGFSPLTVLRGKLHTSFSELMARKGLVIFQFTISVVLIVALLVICKQIEFIQTKNLGFNKDNVICFNKEGKLAEDMETFFSGLKNIPGVLNASNSAGNLTGNFSSTQAGIVFEGSDLANGTCIALMYVNYGFFETLGIEIKEGRSFSREFGSENSKIMFNEAAIKLGIKNPVGKTVNIWDREMQIIGVVKDFHFESLYNEVKPCFFTLIPAGFDIANSVWVRIKSGTERETISRIEKFYKEYNNGLVLEYKFLNEEYQSLYESEKRAAMLSRYFAGMAIIISCLGLFGLAAFTAQRRFKEIGVRKALGSSEFDIIRLLTGDFSKMVLAAILIALPVGYLMTKQWLNDFAYRIDLKWWIFAVTAIITLFIAWITVGSQAIRAANINPAECLKEE
ncbi:MAG: ABC transporter permease [Bacteroidales bacterium]|nr:ABC transporter permease [Bacteroidales bacterium]